MCATSWLWRQKAAKIGAQTVIELHGANKLAPIKIGATDGCGRGRGAPQVCCLTH